MSEDPNDMRLSPWLRGEESSLAAPARIDRPVDFKLPVTRLWPRVVLFAFAAACVVLAPIGFWLHHRWQQRQVAENVEACASALPADLTLATEFADSPKVIDSACNRRLTTVRQKLIEIGAYCQAGVIYDRSGKQVYFLRMQDYGFGAFHGRSDLWQKQEEEAQQLEQRYRVVRMYAKKRAV